MCRARANANQVVLKFQTGCPSSLPFAQNTGTIRFMALKSANGPMAGMPDSRRTRPIARDGGASNRVPRQNRPRVTQANEDGQWLQRLVETTRIIAWEADVTTWCFTYVGSCAVEILGFPIADWFKKDFWVNHLHPDDRDRAIEHCMEGTRRNRRFELEYRMIGADGRTVWFHDIVQVVRGPQGPEVIRGFLIDITERKRAEAILRESEEQFRTLANAAPVMIWMSGVDGKRAWFNKPWLDFVGRPIERELGDGWVENVHVDDSAPCLENYKPAFVKRDEFQFEYRLKRKDGSYRWVIDHGVPLWGRDRAFRGYIGSCIDITPRKHAEEERQKFVSLADNSREFIAMCHQDLRPFYINAAGRKLVGLPPRGCAGQLKVTGLFFPEDQRFIKNDFFPQVLREGHGQVEIRFRHFGTGSAIWMLFSVFSIHDAAGAPVGWATVSSDITERRRLEAELLEIGYRERQRIGHDLHDGLGQKLTALEMKCFLLLEDLADPGVKRRRLQIQVRQLGRELRKCATMSRSLARGLAPVSGTPNGLMDALKHLAHSTHSVRNTECHFTCGPACKLDDRHAAGHLYRIAQEAVNNALKHGDPRRIDISLARGSRTLRLRIKDDGRGFTAPKANKSGMGLDIMHHRAQVIGATLEINSKSGKGVAVICTLPLKSQ
jgi:PAS domain S-box-containing protein